MFRSLRVIILTTKLPEDIWLINKIAKVCDLEGIVLPLGKRWEEFGVVNVLKKRIRRFGIFSVVNQTFLILYRFLLERRKDKRVFKQIFTEKPYDRIENNSVDILEVQDINSEKTKSFIQSKSPDLVIVSGTPILKEPIIKSARIINLHPGYAPQYRGRYGAFWPIYNEEPQLVGATIHFIDKGIDTGAILAQQRVVFDRGDTLKSITYKQQKVGVDLLVKCIKEFDTLAAKAYYKTDCPSKNYYVPGLTHYLKARNWLKRQRI